MQIDLLLRSVLVRKPSVLFHKQIGAGQAEAVDALLYIPHHKCVCPTVRPAGHKLRDLFLQQVAVLVFIHHHLVKAKRQLPGCFRRDSAFRSLFLQDLQRQMLEIVKIQHIFFPFFLCIKIFVLQDKVQESPDRPLCHLIQPEMIGQCPEKHFLLQGVHQVLGFVPQVLGLFLFYRIDVLLPPAGKSSPGKIGKSLRRIVKRFFCAGYKLLHRLQIVCEGIDVLLRSFRRLADRDRLQQILTCLQQGFACFLQNISDHGKRSKLFRRRSTVISRAGRNPALRVRTGDSHIIELLQQGAQTIVRLITAEVVHKLRKLFRPFFVGVFQQLQGCVFPQEPLFSFLQHAIAGVQIDHVKVALDEPGAEAVYGGDVRSMDQDHLFLQMFIVRIFKKRVFQSAEDPLLHLGRCRAGEGHDQHPVDVHRMLPVQELSQNALYQNGGLAGTGRSGHQDAAIAKSDHFFLFICPVKCHLTSPRFLH